MPSRKRSSPKVAVAERTIMRSTGWRSTKSQVLLWAEGDVGGQRKSGDAISAAPKITSAVIKKVDRKISRVVARMLPGKL